MGTWLSSSRVLEGPGLRETKRHAQRAIIWGRGVGDSNRKVDLCVERHSGEARLLRGCPQSQPSGGRGTGCDQWTPVCQLRRKAPPETGLVLGFLDSRLWEKKYVLS